MNNKFFNNMRIAFVMQGCSHCRILSEFLESINFKLPIHKRIKVVDCTLYQNYGIVTDNLILLYSKYFDGYPTVFMGNTKISGSHTRIEYETFLHDLLEDEFVIKESSDFKFNKDCSFKKNGIFKGVAVCH